MKFYDIEKFPTSHYQIDVSLDYLESWIQNELKPECGSPLNLNPDFQRDHVWTKEQQILFMEFFLRGGESGREILFNHPGWQGSYEGDFVIVDGKQRLEAARAFLRGDIPAFGYYIKDYTDSMRLIDNTFKIRIGCLKTRKEVLKWYLAFNSGGTHHTEKELNKVRNLLKKEK